MPRVAPQVWMASLLLTTAGVLRIHQDDDFALSARPFVLVRALFPPFRARLVLTGNAPSSSH